MKIKDLFIKIRTIEDKLNNITETNPDKPEHNHDDRYYTKEEIDEMMKKLIRFENVERKKKAK